MLAMLVGGSLGGFTTVYACVVVPPGTPLEELGESATVFSGKVVEIQMGERDSSAGHKINAVFFEVDRYWKTTEEFNGYRTLVVFTELSGDVCGYEFEGGKKYLVYAGINQNDGSLYTGVGTRTQPIENAQEDLAALDVGFEPTVEVQQQELIQRTTFRQLLTEEFAEVQGGSSYLRYLYPIGIGAAIAAVIAFFTLRRRR